MKRKWLVLAVIGLLGTGLALPALALPGGYDLTWYTIDGSGVTFSTGGGYSLGGSSGQPDRGQMSGGAYRLSGGFWLGNAGGGPAAQNVYLPMIVRQ